MDYTLYYFWAWFLAEGYLLLLAPIIAAAVGIIIGKLLSVWIHE